MIRHQRLTKPWTRLAAIVAIALLTMIDLAARAQDSGRGQAPATTPPASVPAYRQASTIAVITITGPIDQVTVRSVERRLAAAHRDGANAVVFELDTPGGQAIAALEICEIIKTSPIPNTVAWINRDAYSAGTFIALACDEMVVAPVSTIGDCAPILPGFGGIKPLPPAERAKIESPLLAEVVDSARRHGYDEKLVQSFIAVDIALWLVEDVQTGNRLFVDADEYRMLFGDEPPRTSRAQASAGAAPSGQPSTPPRIIPFLGGQPYPIEDSQALTAQQRAEEIEAQQSLPPARPILTPDDAGRFRLVEPVVDSQTLLVLKDDQIRRYGLAEAKVANDQELLAFFGGSTIIRYDEMWSENLVQVLTSMPVRAGLILIFIVGLLWEMATPGVGVPGAFAAVALIVLLGAPALTGLAQWWDVLLVLIGVVLIAVELFLIPGFGVVGLTGLVCLALGFIGTFVAPDPGGGVLPTSPTAREAIFRGLTILLLGIFGGGAAIYMVIRHFGRLPLFSQLVLSGSVADEPAPSLIQAMAPPDSNRPAKGALGIAVTPLRPVGRAEFDGIVHDVTARRGGIDAGTRVRVVSSGPFEIIVEPADHG